MLSSPEGGSEMTAPSNRSRSQYTPLRESGMTTSAYSFWCATSVTPWMMRK